MRYLVRARVKPGCEGDLREAIEGETLGQGSVAEGEYLRNMKEARLCADQTVRWWRFAIARLRCKRNALTGSDISTSLKCRMRMTGANAAMKTEASLGRAAIATARRDWSKG